MISAQAATAIKQLLWVTPQDKVYGVLDGASIPGLLDQLYGTARPQFECLHRGELTPDRAEVAPYLVALEPGSVFTDWVVTQGWGNHWGVFAASAVDLRAMFFHLRTLTVVYGPQGKPMLFRYYDPRVLPVFLSTCGPQQTKEFFGVVARFFTEGDTPATALTLAHADGAVQVGKRAIPVAAAAIA